MKMSVLDQQIQEQGEPFQIIHDYRRTNYLKKRNAFYEKRRKEKKTMLKRMSKFIELWKKQKKQLQYVNKFLVFDDNSKSQEAQLLFSKESTSTFGQLEDEKQKLTTLIGDEFKLLPKKYLFADSFEAFSFPK